jgi:hypothetical protein
MLFLAILADRRPAGVATLPAPFAAFFVEAGDKMLGFGVFFGVDVTFFVALPVGFNSVKPTASTSKHTIAPICE